MKTTVDAVVTKSARDDIFLGFLLKSKKEKLSRMECVAACNEGKVVGFEPRKDKDTGELKLMKLNTFNSIVKKLRDKYILFRDGGTVEVTETDGITSSTIVKKYKPATDAESIQFANLAERLCNAYYVKGKRGRGGVTAGQIAASMMNAMKEAFADEETAE